MSRIGERYSRLVIVARASSAKSGCTRWRCRCDCGRYRVVRLDNLLRGGTRSCGCLGREALLKSRTIHSQSRRDSTTSEYATWKGIKYRCLNPSCAAYEDYGGRGIAICDRWRNSFEAFLADMGPRPSAKHSIDRIDNNGNYEPGNCRWATSAEQANNRRPRAARIRRGDVFADLIV